MKIFANRINTTRCIKQVKFTTNRYVNRDGCI